MNKTSTGYIENVIHKAGISGPKAKRPGEPYSFYEIQFTPEGEQGSIAIATNDPAWQTKIGGPFTLTYSEVPNGKYVRRSLQEKPIYSAKVLPVAQQAKATDDFKLELRQEVAMMQEKLDQILGRIDGLVEMLTEENAQEGKKPF